MIGAFSEKIEPAPDSFLRAASIFHSELQRRAYLRCTFLEDFKILLDRLFRGRLLQHEREPQAGGDFFIVLVETSVDESHNSPVGLAAAFAHFDDFGLHVNGVAMKQRLWKSHLVPTEIGDRGPLRGISNRNSHHHAQSQATVDEPLSELRSFHVFGVEMEWRRIVSHR